MGVVYDNLPDHEGYGLRRLPDGTLAGTWTADTERYTKRFTAWVAACGCGWRDDHAHRPDEAGREAALDRWDEHHAAPLLERMVPREVAELVERARSAVAHLAEVDRKPRPPCSTESTGGQLGFAEGRLRPPRQVRPSSSGSTPSVTAPAAARHSAGDPDSSPGLSERRIPYLKWGRLLRFDPDEIESWLDGARRR